VGVDLTVCTKINLLLHLPLSMDPKKPTSSLGVVSACRCKHVSLSIQQNVELC